jgi:hypothetical protein
MRILVGNAIDDEPFSLRKAAEKMGISEAQLLQLLKSGRIKETDRGFIESQAIDAWIREREDINGKANVARLAATKSYELSGRFTRSHADADALEHFKKELKAFSDAIWNKWNAKAQQDLEAEYSKIEANRLEELKAHGA